jgi:hypothetical protein
LENKGVPSDVFIKLQTEEIPSHCLWLKNILLNNVMCVSLSKIQNNEIGGACGAYGGGERGAQVSGGEN